MRLKNFAINLTLGLTSVALAFFLSEFAVRLIAPQQLILIRPDIWRPIDILGWAHIPSVNTTINTGDRTVRVLTDQDGFRVGRAGRVEADRRILLLGVRAKHCRLAPATAAGSIARARRCAKHCCQ